MTDRSKIVESLTEGRTLSVSNFELVQHFADLIAQAEAARRTIAQEGMTSFSEKGEIVSPIVVAQEKISREIRGWIKDRVLRSRRSRSCVGGRLSRLWARHEGWWLVCFWVCRSPACFPYLLVMWSVVSRRWSFAAGWE